MAVNPGSTSRCSLSLAGRTGPAIRSPTCSDVPLVGGELKAGRIRRAGAPIDQFCVDG